MKSRADRNLVLFIILSFTFSLLLTTIQVDAQAYRAHCKKRCKANKILCTDSTLPGSSGNGSCATTCVDSYLACDSACANAGNPNTCRQGCNSTLSTCTTGCSGATATCNNTYVECINSCNRIPDCTSDSMCTSGGCTNGKCDPSCTSNTRCKSLLGPDGICVKKTGARIGRCLLAFIDNGILTSRDSVLALNDDCERDDAPIRELLFPNVGWQADGASN